MKKIICLLFLLPYCLYADDIKAFLSYSAFMTTDNGSFVETYLSVIGNTVVFKKNEKGKYQGAVEISLLFKQGEDIKNAKKYNLLSPEIDDTVSGKVNFVDQQRIFLPAGSYDLEISISDKNKQGKPFVGNQKVNIDLSTEKACFSDIELLESYKKSPAVNVLSKSGYDLIPYVSNFYPENINKLSFYCELYNAAKVLGGDEKFIITYYIEKAETREKMNKFSNFSRQTANTVNILLTEFPIEELPSGNYNLVIEARDKTNQLVILKNIFLQRKNTKTTIDLEDIKTLSLSNSFVEKITSKDTLSEYIKCLRPMSSEVEKTFSENRISAGDMKLMQQYFLNFWKNRDSVSPEKAWLEYYKQVKIAQEKFGNKKVRGYNTDRGRVYLQYGPPDQRSESASDASAHPYEIWQYYKLINKANNIPQTNKMFVFYSPHFTGYDFKLLHSNVIGEIQDMDWQSKIKGSSVNNNPVDDRKKNNEDGFGNHSNDLFNNPR